MVVTEVNKDVGVYINPPKRVVSYSINVANNCNTTFLPSTPVANYCKQLLVTIPKTILFVGENKVNIVFLLNDGNTFETELKVTVIQKC